MKEDKVSITDFTRWIEYIEPDISEKKFTALEIAKIVNQAMIYFIQKSDIPF